MPNVTDSLDFALDFLDKQVGEIRAGLLQALAEFPLELGVTHEGLDRIAVAIGALGYLHERLGQEKRLLDELSALVVQRRCENCSRLFEVDNVHANRAEYCSAACRQAAYRRRRDAAALAAPLRDR